MKIVLDGTFVTPASGTHRYLVELVNGLQALDSGDELVLLTSSATHPSLVGAIEHGTSLAIVNIGAPGKLGRKLRATRKWVRSNHVDVLHSPGCFVAPRAGVAVVVTVHDVNFVIRFKDWMRAGHTVQAARLSLHAAMLRVTSDAVIVPSVQTRDEIARLFRPLASKTHVASYAGGATSDAVTSFEDRKPVVLSVGVLAPQKNLETSIRAFAIACDGLAAGAEYHIVGRDADGYWDRRLHPLVESLGLASSVRYLGQLSDEDLDREYRSARALAFVSRGEGYGFPAAEAVARGLPVIASSTTAIGESIHGGALFVDPDDTQLTALYVQRLLGDEGFWSAHSDAALERRSDSRTWLDVASDHLDVYRSVVRN